MIVNIESPVRKVIIESSLIMKRSESALYELMIVSALQVAEIRPGIQVCTAAHTHHYQDDVIFDDGIHYVTSDCMDYRTYLVFTITPEKYEYELVKY